MSSGIIFIELSRQIIGEAEDDGIMNIHQYEKIIIPSDRSRRVTMDQIIIKKPKP
jgi:hypothetical protein